MPSTPTAPLQRRLVAILPFLLPALLVDLALMARTLSTTGGDFCPILDDAFIYFQYARSFAELHPLAYHAGEAPTTGATSLLYTLLLAIGWLVGCRGMQIMIVAHLIAVAALASLAYAGKRLGDLLVGPPAGVLVAAAMFATPWLALLSVGGMEIGLTLAVYLATTAAALWWLTLRARGHEPSVRGAVWVASIGALASLVRPEGVATACAATLALLVTTPALARWTRWLSPAALLPAGIPAVVAWWSTGDCSTTGQLVKFAPSIADLAPERHWHFIYTHFDHIWNELLAGSTDGPLVPGFRWFMLFGLLATAVHLVRRFGVWIGLCCTAVLLGPSLALFAPLFYTSLAQMDRYTWCCIGPAICVAVLGLVLVGRWLTERTKHLAAAPWLLGAAFVLPHLLFFPRALGEMNRAVHEMTRQQVRMAGHVADLPPSAIVAVNDAGAIAYLGQHRTYDLVGLTTLGCAAEFWSGDGALFEGMEALPPADRPTHLAYYPDWFPQFAASGFAGAVLHSTSIELPRYAAGPVKELRPIHGELYSSGAHPRLLVPDTELVDEIDIAHLPSEAAHDYYNSGRTIQECLLVRSADGLALDGGRPLRNHDHSTVRATPDRPARWVMRLLVLRNTGLTLRCNTGTLAERELEAAPRWQEIAVEIPASELQVSNRLERQVTAGSQVIVMHDWLYQ